MQLSAKEAQSNPIQEQDVCALLAELHMCNTPSTMKDLKAVERYAKKVLDLQKAIEQYKHDNPLNHESGLFNARDSVGFAQITLGKLYAIGEEGIDQNSKHAFELLERVINDPQAHYYYHNEALLTRASLLYKRSQELPLPWFMRVKKIRENAIRRDLQDVLDNNPSHGQRNEVQQMLEEMSQQ
jgi:hypothetical protein